MSRKAKLSGAWILLASSMAPFPACSTPPPPPPDYILQVAGCLAGPDGGHELPMCDQYISSTVKVYNDGYQVAASKTEWLNHESQQRYYRDFIAVSESNQAILIIDQVDNTAGVPKGPGIVSDSRPVSRAVRYSLGSDRLINEISIMTGGYAWRTKP